MQQRCAPDTASCQLAAKGGKAARTASMKPVPPHKATSSTAVSSIHLLQLGLPCPATTLQYLDQTHTHMLWSGIMDFQFAMSYHRLVTDPIHYITSIESGAKTHLRQTACLHWLQTSQTSSNTKSSSFVHLGVCTSNLKLQSLSAQIAIAAVLRCMQGVSGDFTSNIEPCFCRSLQLHNIDSSTVHGYIVKQQRC